MPELAAVFPPSAAIFTMAAADATSPSPKKQNKLKGKASPARANPTTGVASSPGSAIPVEIDAGAPRTSIFSLSFTRKKKAKPSALAPTVQADTPSVPAPAPAAKPAPAPAAMPAAAASPSKMENESATTVQAHVRMHQAEAAYQDQKLGANAKTETEAATTEVVPVHLPEPGSVFPLGWVVAPAKPIVVTPIARAEPWWHGPESCVTIARSAYRSTLREIAARSRRARGELAATSGVMTSEVTTCAWDGEEARGEAQYHAPWLGARAMVRACTSVHASAQYHAR